MVLIADSGSTKTDWIAVSNASISEQKEMKTSGLNPVLMSEEELLRVLETELLPQIPTQLLSETHEIHFYGAGCRPDMIPKMQDVLCKIFPESKEIEVQSDMLGAARSVAKGEECIVAILGTGSNSCLFDGEKIVRNAPSLGYILGDEGSGAVLGRNLLNALYEGLTPKNIVKCFESEYNLSLPKVIQRVYREPLANRFLASLAPFAARNIDCQEIEKLVKDNFRKFFERNIASYGRKDLPIRCIGGITMNFQKQLFDIAEEEGFKVECVTNKPIEGLLDYHTNRFSDTHE